MHDTGDNKPPMGRNAQLASRRGHFMGKISEVMIWGCPGALFRGNFPAER